jgi:DNA-directed RNA polymerase specialized sigma24 family protein
MDFDDLVAEYRSVGIGPLLYREVRDLVGGVVRSYDPIVYGHVWRWEEAIDDLVQEFCVEVLIGQGQLDYALLIAGDHRHFRRLLARQIRHLLARRRRRTIVDNLLDRSKRLASSPPFRLFTHHDAWSYTLEGKEVQAGSAPDQELKGIAATLASVPVVVSNPSERAPVVYTTESLRTLLERVANELAWVVSVTDLGTILTRLLTPWLPRFLQEGEETETRFVADELSAEERAVVRHAVESIVTGCSDVQRQVLHLKLEGISDTEAARRLGCSRPTVLKRKREVLFILGSALTELSDPMRAAAMDQLGDILVGKQENSTNEREHEDDH